ncbi:MAG: hypothetical protein LJE94_15790 [Deltaproteobacteria bacterium]|nr:hypothetical protein [Deltaproteobacteria bacterium]
MLIFNDLFRWEGFGGKLRLASGQCLLRIYDLRKGDTEGVSHLKPYVVVATDHEASKMSVRSCCSHIATMVAAEHNIPPQRMQFVEHYPETFYGSRDQQRIPRKFDAVEFVWEKKMALHPKWRALDGPLLAFLEGQF